MGILLGAHCVHPSHIDWLMLPLRLPLSGQFLTSYQPEADPIPAGGLLGKLRKRTVSCLTWLGRSFPKHVIDVADKLGLAGPIAEQCQHNMFHRERPEGEFAYVCLD